jgi:hypothetical protein
MSELAGLARRARSAVALADQATLVIQRLGPVVASPRTALLHERDGHPRLTCEPGSEITAAAAEGRSALLRVPMDSGTADAATVVLLGRLARIGVEQVDDDAVDVVALILCSVVLEREHACSRPNSRVKIPLELYTQCEQEPVARYARRVLEHTNAAHEEALRRFVALRHGRNADEVAGARLTELTAESAEVWWVDADGAHSTCVRFARPAGDALELAELLREHLDAH